MKVLLTGGGTGGHITPILAVAHELKQVDPDIQVFYIGERNSKFSQLTQDHASIDASYSVFAGKFRRYYGESWLARLIDIKTNLQNLRDFVYALIGVAQAWRVLRKIRPDVVFLKGGFVGVPVGLAAAALGIPIVTHDSDAAAGLANRMVSRWTAVHATALPASHYPYPLLKVRQVGVLVEPAYRPVTPDIQAGYKKQLQLHPDAPMVLITGGSSGAQQINKAVAGFVDKLVASWPHLTVIHQVGQGKAGVYGNYRHERLKVLEFMKPMHVYTGAADLIVTRAGANAMAEFGIQGKACIVVPSPHLAGGHQLKNARLLQEQEAAIIVQENELNDTHNGLLAAIERLLKDKALRQELANKLRAYTLPEAAHELALIIANQVKQQT